MEQTRETLIEKLRIVQFQIGIIDELSINAEKSWEKAARKCGYCQAGGESSSECSHPKQHSLFCEEYTCPLINRTD